MTQKMSLSNVNKYFTAKIIGQVKNFSFVNKCKLPFQIDCQESLSAGSPVKKERHEITSVSNSYDET